MKSREPSDSCQSRLEALEGNSVHVNRTLERLSNAIAEIGTHLERLEKKIEGNNRERRTSDEEPWSRASRRGHGREELGSEVGSLRANRREDIEHGRHRRRGGRVEARGIEVERWVNDGGPSQSQGESEGEEDLFHDRRPYGRTDYMGGRRRNEDYEEEMARGPRALRRRPKIDFPKFSGGDPYEWMDKAEQYFDMYEVPRRDRITLASFHLEGRASRWWRWIRDQYEKDGKHLGWTAFSMVFMS